MRVTVAFCHFREYFQENHPDDATQSAMYYAALAEASGELGDCETIDDLWTSVKHAEDVVKPDNESVWERAGKIVEEMIVFQDIVAQQKVAQWN